jgi:hypothetical protein
MIEEKAVVLKGIVVIQAEGCRNHILTVCKTKLEGRRVKEAGEFGFHFYLHPMLYVGIVSTVAAEISIFFGTGTTEEEAL